MGKIYEQLSVEERTMIQTQLEMGIRPAAIAAGLNRSALTISRELRRNGWIRQKTPRGPGGLRWLAAMGIDIDELTSAQQEYLSSWDEGT